MDTKQKECYAIYHLTAIAGPNPILEPLTLFLSCSPMPSISAPKSSSIPTSPNGVILPQNTHQRRHNIKEAGVGSPLTARTTNTPIPQARITPLGLTSTRHMQTSLCSLQNLATFRTLFPAVLLRQSFNCLPGFILSADTRMLFTSTGNACLSLAVGTYGYRTVDLRWRDKFVAV